MKDNFQRWHLIYTRPQSEKKVFSGLTENNIESFLPTERSLRVRSDRKKYTDTPLFPSYVFVQPKNVSEYYTSLSIAGALYYVRVGDKIASVSESVINNLKLVVSSKSEIEVSNVSFEPGTKLTIP